jgi:hypothetical protein
MADIITNYDMLWQGSGHEVISSCNLDLYIYENGNYSQKILSEVITQADVGATFTATSGPGFGDFVKFITNGTNGYVIAEVKSVSGQSDLSGWFLESDVFGKPTTGISDLQGCDPISSISLKINNFILDTPGTNLDHDGIWTDATCDFQFSVNVVPEPCTMATLFIGTLFLRRKPK